MRLLLCANFCIAALLLSAAPNAAASADYSIKLASGSFTPPASSATTIMQPGGHVLLQFDSVIDAEERRRLAVAGIELLDYIPNNAYTARVSRALAQKTMRAHGIRWVGRLSGQQKLSTYIKENIIPEAARRPDGTVRYAVVVHRDESVAYWLERFEQDFGTEILGTVVSSRLIELATTEAVALQLAEIDAVLWLEPGMPSPEEHNAGIRNITNVNTVQAAPYNLSGQGVVLAQWDGGRADISHADFGGRVISADVAAFSDHATHVAGTVLGSGAQSSGSLRGMAPLAEMHTQLWWQSSSELISEYNTAIRLRSATIATNSWGFGVGTVTNGSCAGTLGNYFTSNTTLDNIIRGSEGAPISISWSAGNHRSTFDPNSCGKLGFTYGTISPPATAKNVITVGATNSSNNSMTSFSSWGPTDDGRLKPDIVAAGCAITSTAQGGGYNVKCGTSMSAPAIAGILALLTERWNNTIGFGQPLASTFKGVLINTAIDLGPVGPDFQFGHGAVDALAAVEKIGIGEPSYVESEISTGESQTFDITVPSGASSLKITLVWDDPGGVGIGGGTLINDLDLKLLDPFATEFLPWLLNPSAPSSLATTGVDHINNVETAQVDNPTPGLWKALVSGFNIPDGPQKFSLIFTPDSSHTQGSQNALAVFESDDVSQLPGQPVAVSFWVSNLGTDLDSIQVQISDSQGWSQGTTDTVVTLAPFDSSFFEVTVLVPTGTLAATTTEVTCTALSLDDNITNSVRSVVVTTDVLQAVAIAVALAEDTVSSPDVYPFTVTISNTGNAQDAMFVEPQNEAGWNFLPAQESFLLGPGLDSVVAFELLVPAEVLHLSSNVVSAIVRTAGSIAADTATFVLVANNPVAPPSLISPVPAIYSNDRRFDFLWSGLGDSYSLLIATDTQFVNLVRTYTSLTATDFSMPVGDSLPDGIYYWGVRLFVGADSSSLQEAPGIVGVDNVNPGGVRLLSPVGPGYLTDNMVSLIFANDTDSPAAVAPEWYTIQLAADSSFVADLSSIDSVTSLSLSLPSSQAEGRRYWRVQRQDAAGNVSGYSASASFVVDTQPPSVPMLVSPADNASLADSVISFRWQGSSPEAHETSPEYFFIHLSNRPDFGEFSVFNGQVFTDSLVLATDILNMGTSYYWRVKGFDSAGFTSDYSPGRQFSFSQFVCGDIDNSGGAADIGDLTFLIDFLFINFTPVPIPGSANVDCTGVIDIADLTALIDNLFINFTPLCCN